MDEKQPLSSDPLCVVCKTNRVPKWHMPANPDDPPICAACAKQGASR